MRRPPEVILGEFQLHMAAAFSNDAVLFTSDRSLARSARPFGAKHKQSV
jgi:hypothetical protein